MAKQIFNRYELKLPMDFVTYNQLLKRIAPRFSTDAFGDEEGFYSVANLYFDTCDNLFHEQNVNRDSFRQKLRLRVYDNATLDDKCFVEIKKKLNGSSNKVRTSMKLKEAYELLGLSSISEYREVDCSNDQVLQEILYFKNFYQLEPKTLISYDRKALHCIEDPSFRVTFDKNLRSRSSDLRLELGRYGEMFTPPDFVLMEVKVSDSIPLWFLNEIDKFGLASLKFSKYSQSISLSALELRSEEEEILNNIV